MDSSNLPSQEIEITKNAIIEYFIKNPNQKYNFVLLKDAIKQNSDNWKNVINFNKISLGGYNSFIRSCYKDFLKFQVSSEQYTKALNVLLIARGSNKTINKLISNYTIMYK